MMYIVVSQLDIFFQYCYKQIIEVQIKNFSCLLLFREIKKSGMLFGDILVCVEVKILSMIDLNLL